MPEVYYQKDDITACIDGFYENMMERSETMKRMDGYKTGENYAYLGLAAHFLIFDEYVAFMEMLTTKESAAVLGKLKQIVMLGRRKPHQHHLPPASNRGVQIHKETVPDRPQSLAS